ncbi:MAG: hypothetical protein ABIJ09_17905 [Pseudomonadota bacterium]
MSEVSAQPAPLLELLRQEHVVLQQLLRAESALSRSLLSMHAEGMDASLALVVRAQDALMAQRDRRDQALQDLFAGGGRRSVEQVLECLPESQRPGLQQELTRVRQGWSQWSTLRQRNLGHAARGRVLLHQLSTAGPASSTYGARHGRAMVRP